MSPLNNYEIRKKLWIELFGEQEVERLLASNEDIPVHTLNEWEKILGYMPVPKGEGHEVKMWCVNPKTKTMYKQKRMFFTLDELIQES